MQLAAATPNYIPDITYFYKMSLADKFVIADDIQFTSKLAISRASIKTPQGKMRLTVPVLTKGKGKQLIKNVRIVADQNWTKNHWKTILVNYRFSPYFEYYADFFEGVYKKKWTYLIDLNMVIIELIRKALCIENPIIFCSELNNLPGATEKIVDITRQLDCNVYFAAKNDQQFLETAKFQKEGIKLRFFDYPPVKYRQLFGNFLQNLSVIDLLFNEGPEAKWIIGESNSPSKS